MFFKYQICLYTTLLSFGYELYTVYNALLTHNIHTGAGMILCQHSIFQLHSIMPVLVRMQYLKTITRYICILVLHFSTENKQMFLSELKLKFNKYFKMLLHLWQPCPAASSIHSHKTIFAYQQICLLICSLCSCTIRFC